MSDALDPRDRFTAAADDYARFRPDYPDALVDACVDYAGLDEDARVVDIEERAFAHHQVLDWEGLLGRANSSSYVIHGVDDRAGFERALRSLFDAHQRAGHVEFAYRTSLVMWRFR